MPAPPRIVVASRGPMPLPPPPQSEPKGILIAKPVIRSAGPPGPPPQSEPKGILIATPVIRSAGPPGDRVPIELAE